MTVLILSLLSYLIGFVLILRGLGQQRSGRSSRLPLLVAALALISHGMVLASSAISVDAINLALGHVVSLVCLVTVLAFIVAALGGRMTNLGVLVLPVGLFGLLIGQFLSGPDLLLRDPPVSLAVHLTIALLAFAILCVATAQAALLYLQEAQLRQHNPMGLFPALPSLETMQQNLLILIQLGALLLTINLITGAVSNLQLRGTLLSFNHHILLAVVAWVAYVVLLIGHKVYGWRGRIAAKWTMLAFVVLLLAYFGTRFVSSILLD